MTDVDTRVLEAVYEAMHFESPEQYEDLAQRIQQLQDEACAMTEEEHKLSAKQADETIARLTSELAKSKKDDDLLTAALQLQSSTLIEYRDTVQSVYAHKNPIVRFLARFASWPAPKDSTGVAQHLAVVQATAEMARQDARWGAGRQMPNGTGRAYAEMRDMFQKSTDIAFADREGTWRHILMEEVYEALAESNPKKLKLELIQVAAVCLQWVASLILQRPKG